jgi:Tfp pilus assembly protein PilF
MMETKRTNQAHWYLLTGLVLGLAIGLVISLLIVPVVNAEALPQELDQDGKAVYREQIALAYASNQDLNRAWSRLQLLQDANPAEALIAQAQAVVAQSGPVELSRALAELGTAVQQLAKPTTP